MAHIKYKGYEGTVEYSEEDKYYFGNVLNLPGGLIVYEGETMIELITDFQTAVDEILNENNDII